MNLRRWITALAVLVVFTTVAGAQITSNQVSCSVSPAATPNIRAEGIAERVGDVLITCLNGLQLNTGNPADRITITVNYGGAIITNPADAVTNNSDIMLTIDEPNSLSTAAATELGIQGYGPNANVIGVCTVANQTPLTAQNNLTNCPGFSFLTGNPAVYYATASTAGGGANAINVYQGAVNAAGTSVTFTNVPFVPPYVNTLQQGTQVSRVFRITGVRVNPGAASTISATVSQPVTNANDVSVFLPITSPTVAVASVQTSLTASVVPNPLSVCIATALIPPAGQPVLPAAASYLKVGQAFAGAFKTRVVAIDNVAADNATSTGPALQAATAPVNGHYPTAGGAIVNADSESGVLIPITGTPGPTIAGLATSGTRIKALFSGLSTASGTTYYVSVNNVLDFNDAPAKVPATAAGDSTATPWAVLQTQGSEIAAYAASAGAVQAGTKVVTIPVVQLNVTAAGTAEAVWEITNTSGIADNSTYTFGVYAVFGANVLSAAPATPATVQIGYAPTNGSATTSPVGVTTTWIPRYVAPSIPAAPLLSLLPCRTTLLFPYVSSFLAVTSGTVPAGQAAAWATGIAIENTGSDPLGTVGGTGTCTLNFYGPGAPPQISVGPIAPGTAYSFLVNDPGNVGANTNWTGYMFAVCNFNYAHGFAFIEDNTRSMAMGYLGLVLNQQTSSVTRGSFTLGEGLEN